MKRLDLSEIQHLELDILIEFDRVCRANGLRYGLCGGTLLGAVRHGGFIPWDDDIDVMMPRPDYNKLMEIANKEFPAHYKLDTPYNDNDTLHAYGKIYDSRTDLVEFPQSKRIPSHLYIDIFPVDGMPNDPIKQEKHRKRVRKKMLALYGFKVAKYNAKCAKNFIKRLFWKFAAFIDRLMPKKKLIKKIDKLVEKYPFDSSKYCAVIVAGYGFREIMPKQVYVFDNELAFEGKNFTVTAKPDYYLTNIYGNYMTLPPEQDRVHHENEVYLNEDNEINI